MSRTRPAARWLPPPAAPDRVTDALADALRPAADQSGKTAIPREVCALLAARGLTELGAVKRFLRPALADLEAPETIADLAVAADRLAAAVRSGECILVHGDYDVDGICSTTLITRVLRRLGGDVVP
ncbi:MAG: single-stranded-DNA-specific exonuclease RecJ, partial [Gemmatimonadaceae bacterium]